MSIFERTFVITRVLYWLAAGVAAIGLVSALLAWELERARELALLRTLGVTPGGSALLVIAQTLFMGVAAFLAAVPAGLLTALVLTEVINRRAFGWHIDLHLPAPAVPQRAAARARRRAGGRAVSGLAQRACAARRARCGRNDACAPALAGAPAASRSWRRRVPRRRPAQVGGVRPDAGRGRLCAGPRAARVRVSADHGPHPRVPPGVVVFHRQPRGR